VQPTRPDTGGNAFPTIRTTESTEGIKYVHSEPGMHLRDWFAGQALTTLADGAVRQTALASIGAVDAPKVAALAALIAATAYGIADAMIFERGRAERAEREAQAARQAADDKAAADALVSANAVTDRAYTDDEYFAKLDDVQQRLKAITQEIRTMQSHCAAGREDAILEAASHAGLAVDCLDEARV